MLMVCKGRVKTYVVRGEVTGTVLPFTDAAAVVLRLSHE